MNTDLETHIQKMQNFRGIKKNLEHVSAPISKSFVSCTQEMGHSC